MQCSFVPVITLVIFLSTCSVGDAGNPKKLVQACPRLAPIAGAPAGSTVIDNLTVLRLAKKGRIAAISGNRKTAADSPILSAEVDPRIKKKWRSEYRKSVAAIQRLKQKLRDSEAQYQGLQAQFFNLRKENQRLRLQPRLDAKAHQVEQLRRNLQCAMNGFSRTIQEARKVGAQPGWFRDLPKP